MDQHLIVVRPTKYCLSTITYMPATMQTKHTIWNKIKSTNAPYVLAWIFIGVMALRGLQAFYRSIWDITGELTIPSIIAWNAAAIFAIIIPYLAWMWQAPKNTKMQNSVIRLALTSILAVASSLFIEIIILFFTIPDVVRELFF